MRPLNWKSLIFVLILSMQAGGCRSQEAEHAALFTLQVDQSSLAQGQVILTATLNNNTNVDLIFLPWNSPFEPQPTGPFLEVSRVELQGNTRLTYYGPLVKRLAPTAQDYVHLGPGQRIEQAQNITKSYEFCAETEYKVRYRAPLQLAGGRKLTVPEVNFTFTSGPKFPSCEPPILLH